MPSAVIMYMNMKTTSDAILRTVFRQSLKLAYICERLPFPYADLWVSPTACRPIYSEEVQRLR